MAFETRSHSIENEVSAPQGWTDIMTRVNADEYARAYTIFDILNEPDARNLRWQVWPLFKFTTRLATVWCTACSDTCADTCAILRCPDDVGIPF